MTREIQTHFLIFALLIDGFQLRIISSDVIQIIDARWRNISHWAGSSSLAQVTACRLVSATPLLDPINVIRNYLAAISVVKLTVPHDSCISMVSCQKGPTRHAYAWQIGPFWQDTLDIETTSLNLLSLFQWAISTCRYTPYVVALDNKWSSGRPNNQTFTYKIYCIFLSLLVQRTQAAFQSMKLLHHRY